LHAENTAAVANDKVSIIADLNVLDFILLLFIKLLNNLFIYYLTIFFSVI